ncbi:hypothetical protein [Arthrobacter sp. zg-Y769]|uniref:hypothetical protein n=1 Tax=Arthrobacter sp. zg-Y769 TaxID=2894191 RepID=UPI001E5478B5|nr:hypothetical protein [Arthrobacter sp. zg-Y769]MCC9205921.1 hypothetical protein [Arthrobacter sp. zg-Y769]
MNQTPAGDGTDRMAPDATDEGRMLYEERLTFLPGLWMPPAPAWEDLSEADRNRWRKYAGNPESGV